MKRPMTPRGYSWLRLELQKLKAMRPEIAQMIETARGHGDLSENGDYDAAKAKSGMTEARIRDIEARLAAADVIDPRKLGTPTRVVFGSTVKVEDIDSGESRTLSLYGPEDSDVSKGWISFETPLAAGLIGKEVGDVAKVALPGGTKEYEIIDISIQYDFDEVEQSA